MSTIPLPPFLKPHELHSRPSPLTSVPGYPHLLLHSTSTAAYVGCEVDVSRLSELSKHLWIAGRKGNIRPLHKQLLLQRTLVITEDPALHLVWYENRIFIKPCPEALLSWNFWNQCICISYAGDEDGSEKESESTNSTTRGPLYEAACGLLYSYTRLIVHASDYRIAVEHHLLPDIGFPTWCLLAQDVASTVAAAAFEPVPRWRYGELRLSRLNIIYKLTLRNYSYAYMYTSYGAYFYKNLAVLVLGFGYCSVVLAAMQVVAALQDSGEWLAAWCLKFSVVIIFGVFATAGSMVALFLAMFLSQFVRTLLHQRKTRKARFVDS